jgi:hypothetical protein
VFKGFWPASELFGHYTGLCVTSRMLLKWYRVYDENLRAPLHRSFYVNLSKTYAGRRGDM